MHLMVHPQLVASRLGKRPSICCSPFVGFWTFLTLPRTVGANTGVLQVSGVLHLESVP
jgi:hypothetical protein